MILVFIVCTGISCYFVYYDWSLVKNNVSRIKLSNQFKRFWCEVIKGWQRNYKEIGIYYIGYVTVKQICNCNNISSVNPLYLMTNEMIGHFEEKNENKYLALNYVDESKEGLKKYEYEKVWDGIKRDIETINGGERVEYGKYFKTIRFESNDDLPMNKLTRLRLLTKIIRCVFSEGGKFYPQIFLDGALCEFV